MLHIGSAGRAAWHKLVRPCQTGRSAVSYVDCSRPNCLSALALYVHCLSDQLRPVNAAKTGRATAHETGLV